MRKKREKACLRQRKCREKKKREARDRQFTAKRTPGPLQPPPIDLPLHAIFPCLPPSSSDNCLPNNSTRKRERSSPLHDTKKTSQVIPAPSSSPHPSNSCQPDINTRTTPIPSVSPPPAPAILRRLPKKRYLFSAVMPYSNSCEDGGKEGELYDHYRGSSSEVHNDDDDDGLDSKVHRVTPLPAVRSYHPRNTNSDHSVSSSDGNHHPTFAVDALLSMGVPPHVCSRTGDDAGIHGGGGYRLPPPPQLPPLLSHYPSNSYFSPLSRDDRTPLPSKRARLLSPYISNGYRSYPLESQFRSY